MQAGKKTYDVHGGPDGNSILRVTATNKMEAGVIAMGKGFAIDYIRRVDANYLEASQDLQIEAEQERNDARVQDDEGV